MHFAVKRTVFDDLVFDIYDEVYEPSEDSFLFAENLHVKLDSHVLDVGTGSGLLAVVAAKQGAEVVAVDINPFAIRCAKQNAERNRVSGKIAFLLSDLLSAFSEVVKFDRILFNSPYLPSEQGEEETWLGKAWAGGLTGRQVIDKFISQAPRHLATSGEILLLQSTMAGVESTQQKFKAAGMKAEIVACQGLPFFETLILLRAISRVE